jgi:soluble lytic murein transglycosylase-like protein
MTRSFRPRQVINIGLIGGFFVLLVTIFNFSNTDNFASLAYPPIPKEHYRYIDAAAEHCKVPSNKKGLIAAIAWKESTFRANAQSGAGAIGVMQVLRGTGKGVADKYQIAGLNADTFTDPALGYKMGTCYFADLAHRMGDGTNADFDNPRVVKAALIGYNAGPARGESFLAGRYNGPISSLGYADRIMAAEAVYAADIKRDEDIDLQIQETSTTDVITSKVRDSLWTLFLRQ